MLLAVVFCPWINEAYGHLGARLKIHYSVESVRPLPVTMKYRRFRSGVYHSEQARSARYLTEGGPLRKLESRRNRGRPQSMERQPSKWRDPFMDWRRILVIAVCLLAAASVRAEAGPWTLDANAGVGVPTGTFSDAWKSGLLLGGALDYTSARSRSGSICPT